MAIEQAQKNIADYRRYYHRAVVGVLLATGLTMTLSLGILLQFSSAATIDSIAFWLIIASMLSIGLMLTIVVKNIVVRPLCRILDALAYKTGEPNADTPPNPNHQKYTETGFKAVLQSIYDSSPRKPAAENALSNAKKDFLTQALNSASFSVIILNSQRKIVFASSAAPITQSANGETRLALDFLNDKTITDWLDETAVHNIKSEHRWHHVATDPGIIKKTKIYDIIASYEKGSPSETVILLIDRSDHYLPEEEDLNFIAFAAHELRGPITVIRGYLDIIADEFADRLRGDEPELVQRLIVSANRLSSYIDNILNVAKFDRHHLKIHLLEDTIEHIYASIADDMQLRASTQHRLLSVNIPKDLPTVAADRGSVGEVISNLIDNAIKYSFEGGAVTVRAEQKGDFVEVSVQDNGVGMPVNVLNNLFHKFYRSHRSRESVAGTGIGLYLCKAFIESHGGSISARSRENEGSTFSFTLPIYSTVKDKLLEDGQLNDKLIRKGNGWIKNHSMYRD